jgi:hypothetical protein
MRQSAHARPEQTLPHSIAVIVVDALRDAALAQSDTQALDCTGAALVAIASLLMEVKQ